MNIKEDYVSFELAELLRDKGFNVQTQASITVFAGIHTGTTYVVNGEEITPKKDTIIPTLQMAMKWLREEKNIFIDIYYDEDVKGYLYSIIKLVKGTILNVSDLAHNTYEEACEAAIKYCLENLI